MPFSRIEMYGRLGYAEPRLPTELFTAVRNNAIELMQEYGEKLITKPGFFKRILGGKPREYWKATTSVKRGKKGESVYVVMRTNPEEDVNAGDLGSARIGICLHTKGAADLYLIGNGQADSFFEERVSGIEPRRVGGSACLRGLNESFWEELKNAFEWNREVRWEDNP